MSYFLGLLKEIRARPGMYIGTPALTKLASFLRGFDYAVWKLAQGEADPLLGDFRDWVHKRYSSTSKSWEDMILSDSAGETEAFYRFWELLDEFLKQYPESAETQNNGGPLGEKELQAAGSRRPA